MQLIIESLNDLTYNELIDQLIKAKINTYDIRTHPMQPCCDGAIKTIIVYHNGKKNYIETMFEPRILRELIGFLYDIPDKADLERTEKTFTFEE